MMDFLYIGSTPVDEPCVGVESSGAYVTKMKAEVNRFKELLEKIFKPLLDECEGKLYFLVKREGGSDFGVYWEVVVKFDDEDEKAREYAYFIEAHAINTWDEKGTFSGVDVKTQKFIANS